MKNFKLIIITSFLVSFTASANFQYLNESELGSSTTGGNAEATSANLKQTSTFVIGKDKYIFNGVYNYAESAGTVVVRNWAIGSRIDHTTQKKLDLFVGLNANGNKFSGYYERFDVDLGAKHYLSKPKDENDKNKFYVELGLRWAKENRVNPDSDFNDEIIQGRLFIEYQQELHKNFYYDFTLENIGNLEHPGRYRGIFTASANSVMTKYLTLKLAYNATYDDYLSKEGLKRLDYTYTTSILANF